MDPVVLICMAYTSNNSAPPTRTYTTNAIPATDAILYKVSRPTNTDTASAIIHYSHIYNSFITWWSFFTSINDPPVTKIFNGPVSHLKVLMIISSNAVILSGIFTRPYQCVPH